MATALAPEPALEAVPRCSSCGGRSLHEDSIGDVVCDDCGLVLKDVKVVSLPPPSRDGVESTTSGGGHAPLRAMSGTLPYSRRDAFGRSVSGRTKLQLRRFRRIEHQARKGTRDFRREEFYVDLAAAASRKDFPESIAETAKSVMVRFFRICEERGEMPMRGRPRAALIGAALYYASRMVRATRDADICAAAAGVGRAKMFAAYRAMTAKGYLPRLFPASCVEKLKLVVRALPYELPPKTREAVERLARICDACPGGRNLVTGDPATTVAACITLAARAGRKTRGEPGPDPFKDANGLPCNRWGERVEWLTQEGLARAANITQVSIRNNLHRLENEAAIRAVLDGQV